MAGSCLVVLYIANATNLLVAAEYTPSRRRGQLDSRPSGGLPYQCSVVSAVAWGVRVCVGILRTRSTYRAQSHIVFLAARPHQSSLHPLQSARHMDSPCHNLSYKASSLKKMLESNITGDRVGMICDKIMRWQRRLRQ